MTMTPTEFAAEMELITVNCGGDPERAHAEMDDVMCKVLCQLGYINGVSVFVEQDKWYG